MDIPTYDAQNPRPLGQRLDEAASKKITPITAGRTEEQIAKDYQERMLKLLEPVTALVNEARREHGMSIGFSYTPPNGFGIQMLASLEITKKLC